jgi:hypothetical protein
MPKTYADSMKGWQHRLRALADNADELAHLQSKRAKLEGIQAGTLGALRDQAATKAVKQEASRLLEALVNEGNKVDSFLCAGLREHYGNRSEKLAEFDLQPFRGRRPAKALPPPPPIESVK